jgi:hypothetical protein
MVIAALACLGLGRGQTSQESNATIRVTTTMGKQAAVQPCPAGENFETAGYTVGQEFEAGLPRVLVGDDALVCRDTGESQGATAESAKSGRIDGRYGLDEVVSADAVGPGLTRPTSCMQAARSTWICARHARSSFMESRRVKDRRA